MPDERDATLIGGVEARLDRFEQRFDSLEKDMAELKGTFVGFKMALEQMDKRLSNVERLQQWTLGIVLTTWIMTMLAIITMSMTILSKLK